MSENRTEFVAKIKPVCAAIETDYLIRPKMLAVQAAHESRWGESRLTVDANNLFGMTGRSWVLQGRPVYYIITNEYSPLDSLHIKYWDIPGDVISTKPNMHRGGTDLMVRRPFRQYLSWEESARDWATMISQAAKYQAAYQAAKDGHFDAFADAVALAGYATDKDYATELKERAKDPAFDDLG